MFEKYCPACGHHITVKRFCRIRGYIFTCPGCGADLKLDFRTMVLAAVVQAFPMTFALGLTFTRDTAFWWTIPLAMAVGAGIYFLILRVIEA